MQKRIIGAPYLMNLEVGAIQGGSFLSVKVYVHFANRAVAVPSLPGDGATAGLTCMPAHSPAMPSARAAALGVQWPDNGAGQQPRVEPYMRVGLALRYALILAQSARLRYRGMAAGV